MMSYREEIKHIKRNITFKLFMRLSYQRFRSHRFLHEV